jgi:hypothetical protein
LATAPRRTAPRLDVTDAVVDSGFDVEVEQQDRASVMRLFAPFLVKKRHKSQRPLRSIGLIAPMAMRLAQLDIIAPPEINAMKPNATKPRTGHELDLVRTLIGVHTEGVGISDLTAALLVHSHPVPRRTLQRRLDQLVRANRIVQEGGGRSIRYASPVTSLSVHADHLLREPDTACGTDLLQEPGSEFGTNLLQEPGLEYGPGEAEVPLSTAGLEVRDAVCRPFAERKRVGYNREFLDSYQPNESFYLSTYHRERLHEAGHTPHEAKPAGTHARDILGRLLIDLSWASSRLEGNTYSWLDTQSLIAEGHVAQGKNFHETQMILNHKAAIEMIVEGADDVGFNRYTVLNLHAILSESLMQDPSTSGCVRKSSVGIGGSVFQPLCGPQRIDETLNQVLMKADAIVDPFEQAFFAMVHLPYLQPFADVNKRVSRLAANIPLIRQNLCPVSFINVPTSAYVEGMLGVYELNRVERLRDVFVSAYSHSCQRYMAVRQALAEPDAFRFKYQIALKAIVREVVYQKLQGTHLEIERFAKDYAAAHHVAPMIAMVQSDLDRLYYGNIERYRLRLSEYRAWPYKRAAEI